VRLSALRVSGPLPPGRFLVLISVKSLSIFRDHIAAGRIRSIGKSNDVIGNRTRDLPACRIAPQRYRVPPLQCRRLNQTHFVFHLLFAVCFHGLLFDPEDEGDIVTVPSPFSYIYAGSDRPLNLPRSMSRQ
jgi:hypothetical protein